MTIQLLSKLIQRWLAGSDPEKVKSWFYAGQVLIGALIIGGLFWLRDRGSPSGFKVREADLKKKNAGKVSAESVALADARMSASQKRSEPLRLTGISLSGEPHEILGISRQANEAQIKTSYRELMKRYHPDLIGRPGSREWQDAQKIAEAINRAKDHMLTALRRK
jgi:hypothetical protein